VLRALFPYLTTLGAVAVALLVVGVLQTTILDPQAALLVYLVPVVLAASRWGRGTAIFAVVVSLVCHDLLFVDPRGTLFVSRVDEALGLALLLFTALVTAHLADAARREAYANEEARVMRQADALKTALLHAVTHNLRTPLTSIKASASGLRQAGHHLSDADRVELLTEIEEESDRLSRLVTKLLDASRLEAGALETTRQPEDVRELVTVAVDRLRPVLDGRIVQLEFADVPSTVACDYAQIDQVVTNLLENAAYHTPPGTDVWVRTCAVEGALRVEVEDSGPGIPEAERERLFRAFERGPSRAPGTGLGLTIARGFVEAHGGRLWLDSADSHGARFVFTLPLLLERS
jgi:two-component system sensor histidine kinase KdpD